MKEYQKAEFDEYAETYDEKLKDVLGPLGGDTEKFAEYKVQLLKTLIQNRESIKILDFGCGTGRSLLYLKKYFPEDQVQLFGCDVSEDSLKIAKKAVPSAKCFLNDTYERIEDFGETYDAVMIACVLHHIDPKERKDWIKAIAKNLNHGGKIAVFEHNLINPFTNKIVKDAKNVADNINWMLTMSEIEKLLLCDDSMRVLWKGYTLFSPFRPSFMTSVEKCLKWLPLGAQQCIVVEKC